MAVDPNWDPYGEDKARVRKEIARCRAAGEEIGSSVWHLIRHIEWNERMSASRADFLPSDAERRALQEMGLSDVPFPRYDR